MRHSSDEGDRRWLWARRSRCSHWNGGCERSAPVANDCGCRRRRLALPDPAFARGFGGARRCPSRDLLVCSGGGGSVDRTCACSRREPHSRRPVFSRRCRSPWSRPRLHASGYARTRHLAVERRRGGADREANRLARNLLITAAELRTSLALFARRFSMNCIARLSSGFDAVDPARVVPLLQPFAVVRSGCRRLRGSGERRGHVDKDEARCDFPGPVADE